MRTISLLAAALAMLAIPRASEAQTHTDMRDLGEEVYGTYCVGCHGEDGAGAGPAARMLLVKPRDFTSGIFKFRSTPNGTLPTDEDLLRIVTNGVNRTAMPPFALVPDVERRAVVEYLKGFYPQWAEIGAGTPIVLPPAPPWLGSPESIARGRQLYEMLDCGQCHGDGGRGDGPSSRMMAPDGWGNPQKPFDFTRGDLKSGGSPVDVYRTFMTGLNGTAMPSYADVFSAPDGEAIRENDAWNLVSYIVSLRGRREAKEEKQP
jgi:cytochrome c oxidase cbb3-type subunit 2